MPTIADYLRLAPFSLDELVGAVNGLLRDHPRLQVSRRTLRYYVAEGAIPPPSGPPKFARYDGDHLLRALGLRAALGSGRTLSEARREAEELSRLPIEAAVSEIERRVVEVGDRVPSLDDAVLAEERAEEAFVSTMISPAPAKANSEEDDGEINPSAPANIHPVIRISLDDGIVLELPGSEIIPESLRSAQLAIYRLLDSL